MGANNLWVTIAQQGLAAARDAAPEIPVGTFIFYYATDTHVLSVFVGGAWNNVSGTGIGGPAQLPVLTVAALPAAAVANKGQIAYVTNLNVITIGAPAAAGVTGAGIVVSNGTNWIVGGLPAQS